MRTELRPLTSLRFVAALSVFVWHAFASNTSIVAASGLGYAGVGFFFILSGFILTYTYYADFRGGDGIALRRFYIARFARVYPLHIVGMVLALVVLAFGGIDFPPWNVDTAQRAAQVALQAVLLQAWVPNVFIYFGVNIVAWSLSVEAFFYAIFPLLLVVLQRQGTLTYGRLLLLAASIWLALVLGLAPQHASWSEWRFYVFPLARLPDFIVGMLLGRAVLLRKRLPLQVKPTLLEWWIAAAIPMVMIVAAIVPMSLHFAAWMMPWFGAAILIFADGSGALSRVLSHPFAVRLGELSYAFYLVHFMLLRLCSHIFAPNFSLAAIGVAFVLSLALSAILFHGVERPLRRWIVSKADVSVASPAAVAA
jgi:peptidoglycan/LPS O-acetylase OafA/YrhL